MTETLKPDEERALSFIVGFMQLGLRAVSTKIPVPHGTRRVIERLVRQGVLVEIDIPGGRAWTVGDRGIADAVRIRLGEDS